MISEKPHVLYIDDEANNLNSFKAAFRRYFNVFITTDTEEAKDILKDNEIHVVITDQRMPKVTGVDFLEYVLKNYPKPVRILLTAYSDIEAVINSINKSKVSHYITKPWDEKEVKRIVEEAYYMYRTKEIKSNELNYYLFKASHDLRGPLVSMGGLVKLTERQLDDPDAVKQNISLMDGIVKKLDNTLLELIEYKRIENAELRHNDIFFTEIINDILESLSYFENYKNITLILDIDQPETFQNDRMIIRSVLQNLIHNAIKYTNTYNRAPQIKITGTVNADEAVIEIEDNGIGMTEKTKESIFNMFFRGEDQTSGSGLGLYIVNTGINKLRGKINVESEEYEGSTFKITIPGLK